jgi:hypothetical protein
MIDIERTSAFMDAQARLIDRRRFDLLLGRGEPEAVLSALAAYANPDGGFGWALHPDLRSPSSQPVGAMHGFEILAEIAPHTSPLAVRLCDWLDSVSLDDGGLPFALPGAGSPGSAPLWGGAAHDESSLLITSAVCAFAHGVAEHDPQVAEHPWLARATDHCLSAIAGLERPGFAIVFRFVLQLLDALHGRHPDAAGHLERLGACMPASGSMAVVGGAEGERMRPTDFSPAPDRPARTLLRPAAIEADLDEIEAELDGDGGWDVDFTVYSPAAAIEWRGEATLRAVRLLKANGRLEG